MDKYIVIKNGLVLTLDRRSQTGYFNIIIKNNKFFFIDYESKFNEKEFKSKNPEAEIIDASDKIIMPGFFNSKLISTYTLNKLFFKKCSYENINTWLSLALADKYFSGLQNAELLKDLLKISYERSLRNGELFVNESSHSIGKDFFDIHFTDTDWIKQYYNLTVYDYTILQELKGQQKFIALGFNTGEEINNYSLTSIRKSLSENKLKLFIEASLSQKAFDSVRKIFGKTFINVLNDMELISPNTILSNPIFLNETEIEIIKKKKASLLILPSDYLNLSGKKTDFDELILSGINIIIGTGYTGNDILSEINILSVLADKNNISFESLLKMIILNPSLVFGVSNVTGSVERNKSADLIFFNLEDIRNAFTFPETNSESVCEFIVRNLTTSDISDVILKGEILINDRKKQFTYIEQGNSRAKEISSKIYSAGKYYEFREKYMMRGRVDKLSLGSDTGLETDADKSKEIFVDMTETEPEYLGEGEFTILGKKEEEFEKPREKDTLEIKKSTVSLREIRSLEDELNLFDIEEEEQQVLKPPSGKKEIKSEKEILMKIENKDIVKEELDDRETNEEKKPDYEEKKLKFGFGEEE